MNKIKIMEATSEDINKIIPLLSSYNLDNEEITYKQFLVAYYGKKIVGFGRIKKYEMICEISSIGVLEEYRNKGIGTHIVKKLIDIFPGQKVWLTTKKPEFFTRLGFRSIDNPPIELKSKSRRICSNFLKPHENMVFMLFEK